MKKILAIVLAAVLTLSLAACGSNTPGSSDPNSTAGKKSTTVGALTLTDMGAVTGKPGFTLGDVLSTHPDDDSVQILDLNGNLQDETVYADIESLAGSVVVVSGKGAPVGKNLGIVDRATGKELISCEIATVTAISERFLLLTYMEGPGTEDDHFHHYVDENHDLVDIQGYGLVFDREAKQIVPNIKVTGSYLNVAAAGSTILLDEEDRTYTAYNHKGEKLYNSKYLFAFDDSKLLMEQTSEGVVIYDGDFNKISTLEGSLNDYDTLDGVTDMLVQQFPVADDASASHYEYRLVDLQGKVLSKAYKRISNAYLGKYVSWYDQANQQSGIADLAGNEILPPITDGYYNYLEPGYFLKKGTDSCTVYNLDGTVIAENVYQEDNNKAVFCKSQRAREVLVLSTGAFLPSGDRNDALTKSLVLIDHKLYDTVSGQVVLEDVDNCVCTGENLYAWDQETEAYHRYLVTWAK